MVPRNVVIIPARFASVRLPAKPLVKLGNQTMIERTFRQVSKAKRVDEILVATDNERIASVVLGFGGKPVMTPPELASGTERVAYAAAVTYSNTDLIPDIVINVQGDEPMIPPEIIDDTIQLLLEDDSAPIATMAKPIDDPKELDNPACVKLVMDGNNYAMYFSRTAIPYNRDESNRKLWLNDGIYFKHMGIYAFRRSVLEKLPLLKPTAMESSEKLEQLRFLYYGYKIKVGITQYDSMAIDTPADVALFMERFGKREE